MCLVIASPTGKRIPDEILRDAASSNRDGCGIAWSDKGKIHFRKGLTIDEVIAICDGEAAGKSHVVHCRIATVGGVCDELTHPFSIDANASVENEGEADAVLFQNGTFSEWKDYLLQASAASHTVVPEPPWSDSRAVAFLCHVYGKHVLSLLDNHSRFLVFDAKEPVSRRIMLWGTWHTFEEFKFSTQNNIAFRKQTQSYSGSGGSSHSNFPRGAEADDEPEIDVSVATTAPTTSSTSATTSSNSGQSSVNTPSSPNNTTTSSRRPKFRPKANYDYWRVFDKTGSAIKGDNEKEVLVPSVDAAL